MNTVGFSGRLHHSRYQPVVAKKQVGQSRGEENDSPQLPFSSYPFRKRNRESSLRVTRRFEMAQGSSSVSPTTPLGAEFLPGHSPPRGRASGSTISTMACRNAAPIFPMSTCTMCAQGHGTTGQHKLGPQPTNSLQWHAVPPLLLLLLLRGGSGGTAHHRACENDRLWGFPKIDACMHGRCEKRSLGKG